MKAVWINPFLKSLPHAFQTLFNCQITRGEPCLETGKLHDISGLIGFSGRAVGTLVLSLSESVAVHIASAMLMTELTRIDDDVVDAVGELTNIVAGAAKAELLEFELSVGLPSVIIGGLHRIRFPSNVTPLSIPYQTPWGALNMEIGLSPLAAPTTVGSPVPAVV